MPSEGAKPFTTSWGVLPSLALLFVFHVSRPEGVFGLVRRSLAQAVICKVHHAQELFCTMYTEVAH